MHNVRVRDVMTADPATCRPTDLGTAAARIMWDRDCGAVPVVDDAGHPIGMITDRDLCMAAYLRSLRLDQLTVDSVMTHSAVTCSITDRLDAAGHAMADARVRRLPVVDASGVVCGVLSITDIIRARAHRGAQEADGVIETLATITEPRRHELGTAMHAGAE
jgi:CBS domain-containing protein